MSYLTHGGRPLQGREHRNSQELPVFLRPALSNTNVVMLRENKTGDERMDTMSNNVLKGHRAQD